MVQEAFLRIYEHDNVSTIRNLKAFVWRTARNLVLDSKKIAHIRSKYDFEIERLYFCLKGENLSPEFVIGAKEQLQAINALLLTMPDRRRRALLLYRIEGLTLAQTADQLGISITAVRKHIARAQAQLNALFLNEDGQAHD